MYVEVLMEENICRLCLNFTKYKFEAVDAVTTQMLQILPLRLDLVASSNPILCQDCSETIKKAYSFKSTCIDTEQLIHSFSAANGTAVIDIKDVYQDSKGVDVSTSDDFNVCRFCLNEIGNSCVSMQVLMKDVMYADILSTFMPKMVIKDSVICTYCKEILEHHFKFTKKCLNTEELINKYRQSEETNSTSQIKLNDVLNFLFKENYCTESTQITLIKQELSSLEDVDHNTDVMYDKHIKCEMLDIKDEDVNSQNICKDASKVKMYICEICTYETKYKSTFKRHMLLHKFSAEVKMYKCGICTFETTYKYGLKNHMLTHKDISEVDMYRCEICTYETKYKKGLKEHMLIHKDTSEVEMHKCAICTYETKYKERLKKHMITHKDFSEVKVFKCGMCTYETKYKCNMKYHMIIHKDTSEVEVYKCSKCANETRYKKNHKKHILKHNVEGEQKIAEGAMYKCEICSYESKYKDYLKRHTLIHKDASEVEMYKCERCTFETKYKYNITKHMLKHRGTSEVKMHKCEICTYETKYKTALKRHIRTHNHTPKIEMDSCVNDKYKKLRCMIKMRHLKAALS